MAEQVLDGRTPISLDLRVLRLIVAQRPRIVSVPGRACLVENALRLLLGRVEAQASVDGGATGSGERRVAFPPPNLSSVTSASGSLPDPAAMKMTVPQQQYVHHAPLPYSANESQVVGPMPSALPVVLPRTAPTMLGHGLAPEGVTALNALASEASSALPDTRRVLEETLENLDAPTLMFEGDADAATVLDHAPIAMPAPPAPGTAFRLVNPGDSVETVRARMLQMGLDPDARMSIIPKAPPRQKTRMGVGPTKRDR